MIDDDQKLHIKSCDKKDSDTKIVVTTALKRWT